MVASCGDFSEAVLIRHMQTNCQSLGGLFAAEEGLRFRDITEVIGRRVNVPVARKATENGANHFGWFTAFAATEMSGSSQRTQEASARRKASN